MNSGSQPARPTMESLNRLAEESFVQIVGPVFEHSPWIAAAAWAQRPYGSLGGLHSALCEVVRSAGAEQQLDLIRAHPDLVGRAALAGTLTPESTREQAAAGLGALTPAEVQLFQRLNGDYRAKFGFPFVICARQNKKEAILKGFQQRLNNSPAQETQAALEEIFKIAELRLRDLIQN